MPVVVAVWMHGMSTLLAILRILPAIIAAVKAIEDLFPGGGQGPAKLNLILDIIKTAGAEVEPLIPQITSVIGKVVAFANAVGAFTKST
jgi:hypothetical protein